MQHRQAALQGLFHRRDQYFLQAVVPNGGALRALAQQWCDFLDADFSGFFQKPFEAVDLLGGCNSNMEPGSRLRSLVCFQNTHYCLFFTCFQYFGFIKKAVTVGHLQPVTFPPAQYGQQMPAFFGIEPGNAVFYFCGIKNLVQSN